MPILWYMISEESREKLRRLLPHNWRPPREDGRPITIQTKIEDVEEIDKLMRQPPRGRVADE